MDELVKVFGCENEERKLDVVFLHGLGGDPRGTWTEGKTKVFWPEMLGKDLEDVGVWSLGYEASPVNWLGHTMPLEDRATNALEQLAVRGIGKRPVVFVTHSLGGLVVKWMLRHAFDYHKPKWEKIAEQTKGVVFFATPHVGADLAKFVKDLGTVLRTSVSVRDLEANSAALRGLNLWYRNNVPAKNIQTSVYFETQNVLGVRPVDEGTADPGIAGVIPIPIGADHFEICKFANPDDIRYLGVRQFIEDILTFKSPPSEEQKSLPTGAKNIPTGAPHFTGRVKVLESLHESLRKGENIAVTQAITGTGGVGKSSVAIEYVKRFGEEYAFVFWCDATRDTTLLGEFIRLYELLPTPRRDLQDAELIREETLNLLNDPANFPDKKPCLLVFDNIEDPVGIQRFVPAAQNCRLLCTSRLTSLRPLKNVGTVPLEVMTEAEALDLFRTALSRNFADEAEKQEAAALAYDLGYLPLALEQAVAYLAHFDGDVTFAQYRVMFRSRRLELLNKYPAQSDHYKLTVATTWDFNFQKIQGQPVQELVRYCAFLAPDRIPITLFFVAPERFPANLANALQQVHEGLLPIAEMLDPATGYSLLRYADQQHEDETARYTLSLHRLLQEVIKDALSEAERKACIETLATLLLEANSNRDRVYQVNQDTLLPHQLACLEEAIAASVETKDCAALLNETAFNLYHYARYANALPLFQRALTIREKVLGPEHPDTALSLNNLASLYRQQGDYANALPLFQRALTISEKVLGPEHPDTATSLNNLASLYRQQGDYANALPLFQRALTISEKVLGPEHPDTATSLNNLAGLYDSVGDYANALPLFQRALTISEKVLGPEHPDTATSLNNLASLYRQQGDYANALPLFQRALTISEKVLGPEHPDTATSLNNLAGLYDSVGDYANALPLFQRALTIREKVLGPEHPDTALSLNNLASLYRQQGDYANALPLFQRALTIREKVLGPEHPDTAGSLNNLASLYRQQGDYANALPLFQRAVSVFIQVLGQQHPNTQGVIQNYLTCLMESGNEDAVRQMAPGFVEWYRKRFPEKPV